MVLCGDFFQLPPVPDRVDDRLAPFPNKNPMREDVKFAFEAACWNALIPADNRMCLTQVYRQQDPSLRDLLCRMRYGQLTIDDNSALWSCQREVAYQDGIEPVAL